MWVVRNKDSSLMLSVEIPKRFDGYWLSSDNPKFLDKSLFPNLKWEDEPVEVELTIKSIEDKMNDSISFAYNVCSCSHGALLSPSKEGNEPSCAHYSERCPNTEQEEKKIDMNNLISDDLIKRILELSDKFDDQYFVDHYDLNKRITYIKENLLDEQNI